MEPKDVEARLKSIREAAGDPENAHAMEDVLHGDVLQAIADGVAVDGATCARLALTSVDIDFPRWYA